MSDFVRTYTGPSGSGGAGDAVVVKAGDSPFDVLRRMHTTQEYQKRRAARTAAAGQVVGPGGAIMPAPGATSGGINMTYVVIGVAVVGLILFLKKKKEKSPS